MAEPTLGPSVFDRLLKDRIIWLGSEVRDDNANEIAAKLLLAGGQVRRGFFHFLLHLLLSRGGLPGLAGGLSAFLRGVLRLLQRGGSSRIDLRGLIGVVRRRAPQAGC